MRRKDFIKGGIASIAMWQMALGNPVKSNVAARHGFTSYESEWKFPYVTDGMVAMWDAEWNAGIGVHEPSPQTWLNLAGNGLDMISNGDPIFYDNYIQPTQQSEMWHTEITDLCDDILENATLTMEVVGECVVGKTSPKFCMFGGGALAQGFWVSAACPDPSRIGVNFRVGGTATGTYRTNNILGHYSVVSDGATAIGRYMSSSGMLERSTSVTSPITNYVSKRFAIGYRYNYYVDNPMVNGEKIFSVRVYDRALTIEEILKNYEADAWRFGL